MEPPGQEGARGADFVVGGAVGGAGVVLVTVPPFILYTKKPSRGLNPVHMPFELPLSQPLSKEPHGKVQHFRPPGLTWKKEQRTDGSAAS